ncbi:hypothetical protein Q5752_000461 [Cryptotrichosporon argae]
MSEPRARDYFRTESMGALGHDYLGRAGEPQRDRSLDNSTLRADDGEAYNMSALHREDSHTPLHEPSSATTVGSDGNVDTAGGYQFPPSIAYPPGASAPHTPDGSVRGRVHYPPSLPLAAGHQPPHAPTHAGYTTIPLHGDGDERLAPAPASAAASGRATPDAHGSRSTTPSGRGRKGFSAFLPLHNGGTGHSSPSMSDAEKAGGVYKAAAGRPKSSRTASWDMLGGLGLAGEREWEEYNPAHASVENLRFAEGDVGTTRLSRLYYWALNSSIVVRWALYIIPITALLWIPGIIGVTCAPNASVWTVHLLWWSIWLTVLWCGFWASTAVFMVVPRVWRNTVGSIIPSAKQYTDVIANLGRYAKLIIWMVAVWVSFTPLIINHYTGDQSANSRSDLTTFASILFGLFLCSITLAIEKFCIQMIALQFHRDSYEDRLQDQKFQLKCLTMLYINSHDIPGRSDTLTDAQSTKTRGTQVPKQAIRKALRGLRSVAQTTTTALGNVASEMAGQSVLQTNSPANRVTAAISSANKSKQLARRLFYSFRQGGADHLELGDIARFFPDLETAQAAFQIFDVDGNGDATRDEIEAAVLQIHRDRLSLEASMRDLDGAVRRLDDILLVVVLAIDVLILAAMLTTKLTTLVTSAGSFILSLSWLIGTTSQEILAACIFLFVKHPYDVGDRIEVDAVSYTVVKMNLMSTSFKRTDGKYVWIGHNVLTTKVIENVRRSGATSESFSFEVDFGTSFEHLQELRARMLAFCKENSRDYLPIFDVSVDDIPGQAKMVLKADIRYKSNWQQGALKVQRRNKWICALKTSLAELKIYGPAGAGNPTPDPAEPTKYTLVPYEEVRAAEQPKKPSSPPPTFDAATAAALTDRREIINDPSQDIWGEADELHDGLTTGAPSRVGTPGPGLSTGYSTPVLPSGTYGMRQRAHGEAAEVVSASVNRR